MSPGAEGVSLGREVLVVSFGGGAGGVVSPSPAGLLVGRPGRGVVSPVATRSAGVGRAGVGRAGVGSAGGGAGVGGAGADLPAVLTTQ